jgi:cell division protein FtsB
MFFDQNNWISQWQYKNELEKLQKEKEYYTSQIEKTKKELEELTTNPKSLEKFAREKYLMKKENEEIFLFVQNSGK